MPVIGVSSRPSEHEILTRMLPGLLASTSAPRYGYYHCSNKICILTIRTSGVQRSLGSRTALWAAVSPKRQYLRLMTAPLHDLD